MAQLGNPGAQQRAHSLETGGAKGPASHRSAQWHGPAGALELGAPHARPCAEPQVTSEAPVLLETAV